MKLSGLAIGALLLTSSVHAERTQFLTNPRIGEFRRIMNQLPPVSEEDLSKLSVNAENTRWECKIVNPKEPRINSVSDAALTFGQSEDGHATLQGSLEVSYDGADVFPGEERKIEDFVPLLPEDPANDWIGHTDPKVQPYREHKDRVYYTHLLSERGALHDYAAWNGSGPGTKFPAIPKDILARFKEMETEGKAWLREKKKRSPGESWIWSLDVWGRYIDRECITRGFYCMRLKGGHDDARLLMIEKVEITSVEDPDKIEFVLMEREERSPLFRDKLATFREIYRGKYPLPMANPHGSVALRTKSESNFVCKGLPTGHHRTLKWMARCIKVNVPIRN